NSCGVSFAILFLKKVFNLKESSFWITRSCFRNECNLFQNISSALERTLYGSAMAFVTNRYSSQRKKMHNLETIVIFFTTGLTIDKCFKAFDTGHVTPS